MLGPTPLNTGTFVTVDIEATGCRPGTSSILEIGAVRIESGAVVGHFSRLIRPDEPIPAAIEHLTGISDRMVSAEAGIAEVMAEFHAFAADAVLVAHNHRFDMSFLDFEAERCFGRPFPRPVLDTLTLARRLHPELSRHNLRDLAAFYGTPSVPTHRAHPDALATAEVFLHMCEELAEQGVVTAAEVARLCGVAEQSTLARKLALATHLPDTAGLYLFRDDRGEVVYVGRAKNLRTRVRNHFYAADDVSCPSPASAAESIDYFPLASTLDAALLEVRLQDRYAPAFNRDGHQRRRPLYLHVDTSSDFPSLRPTHRRLRSGELLGPLSNEWAATTIADALSEYFGLRRCRCPIEECLGRDCDRRDHHTCRVPEVDAESRDAYAAGVRAALAIFDGGGAEFREVLRSMQERCAATERFEEAAHYRDATRALDRTLAALATARRAAEEGVTALIEGDEEHVTVLVTVHGWLFTTLRFSRAELESQHYLQRIATAVSRALRLARSNPCVTGRRLRDMSIIDSYRQQHRPVTLVISEAASGADAVSSAVRRQMRVPRKRHEAASAG
jgi:DNA polymerase-3 subunit epsilon